jgi:arylsulfatase A-like enzyme
VRADSEQWATFVVNRSSLELCQCSDKIHLKFTTYCAFWCRYSTNIFSDKAIDIIRAQPTTAEAAPFFVYLAYQATHAPLEAPDDWLMRFNDTAYGPVAGSRDRQIFAAMAGCMDEGVGNISAALKASPEVYANTVLFFSGDNGGQVHAGKSRNALSLFLFCAID